MARVVAGTHLMSPEPQRTARPLARESLGAIALLLFSAPALVFGVFLTALKLRTEHRCDGFMANACSSGCSTALSDPWSLVLGIPLSAYATAYYAVLLLIAVFVGLWPTTFVAPARLPLLLLALAGLAVSLALGLYLSLGLGTWCELCTLLYLANLGVFLAAWLLAPEGLLRTLVRGWPRVELVGLTIFTVAIAAFLSLVLVQRRIYNDAAAAAARDRAQFTSLTCSEEQIRALPPTHLRLPASGPTEVVAAVFVDLACAHCRKELAFWRDYQRGLDPQANKARGRKPRSQPRDGLRVEFFHFSADPACGPLDSPGLQRNQSCNAAIALECMHTLAPDPDDPLRHAERLFAMQDGPEPYFALDRLAALEPEYPGLLACMDTDGPQRSVRRHIAFGLQAGLDAPPSTLLVPFADGRPRGQPVAFRGGGKSAAFVDSALAEARARSRSDD